MTDHYKHVPGVECKDVAGHFPYNIGTAIAYLWRCQFKHKTPEADLKKAIAHIEFELERLEKMKQPIRTANEVYDSVFENTKTPVMHTFGEWKKERMSCTSCEWVGEITEAIPTRNNGESYICPDCASPVTPIGKLNEKDVS